LGLIATRQLRKIGFSASARAWPKPPNDVNNVNVQYHHHTHLVVARDQLGDCVGRSITRIRFHLWHLLKHPIKRRLDLSSQFILVLHLLHLPV
jgi:hypothetical protein